MQSYVTMNGKERNQMALIEASLYVTGRPLDVKALGSIIRLRSEDRVRELSRRLVERYRQYGSSIEIIELEDGRFVMQLKSEYVNDVKKLATKQLLSRGPLKTLSFIAFKQPIIQSYVVKVRGNLAYQHIRQLSDVGLVSEERLGRTKVLRTTKVFADYFNLSQEVRVMKKQLEKIFREITPTKAQEALSKLQREDSTQATEAPLTSRRS